MKNCLLHIKHLILAMTILLLSACTDTEFLLTDEPGEEGDRVQLEVFARVNSYNPLTRGATANEEELGETPWILVFSGNNNSATFIEAAQTYKVDELDQKYVVLSKQANSCRLLILGNPQSKFYVGNTSYDFSVDNFKSVLTGKTFSEACSLLLTEPLHDPQTSVPFIGDSFPMCEMLDLPQIATGTRIEGTSGELELKRAVAKVILENRADNFILKSIVEVVDAPRYAKWFQADNNIPSLSAGDLIDYRNDGSAIILADNNSTKADPLYLYESGIGNNTYLIVVGEYNGKDYYYKMEFVDTDRNKIDLLRNHQYTFTIIKALGAGHEQIEDARVAPAFNNTCVLIALEVTDLSAYETIAFDTYYLSLSNSIFIAYMEEGKYGEFEDAFTLVTNCAIDFPKAREIIPINHWWPTGAADIEVIEPADKKIPIVTSSTTDPRITKVKLGIKSTLANPSLQSVELKLGNLNTRVHVRRWPAIKAIGEVFKVKDNYGDFYFLSGNVVDEGDARQWIKLAPGPNADDIRNDASDIVVDNGNIYVHVLPNSGTTGNGITRSGTIYLTTTKQVWNSLVSDDTPKTSFRIKVNITQLGQ